LASLSMTVIEKQNDIALLKSLGANNALIRNIFILEGTFIGLISIVAGSIIGLGFCYGQIYYKWFRIDTTKFIIDSVPITIQSMDIIIIITITLIMTVLATIYPSIRAANTNIVSSIKSE
jgi:lipoprotein-releasing system permease protein